jgi:hypothetical protein
MRIRTRQVITQLAATLAWLLVCVTALILWIGISTHARAQVFSSSALAGHAGRVFGGPQCGQRDCRESQSGHYHGHAPTHNIGDIKCTSTWKLYI